MLSTLIHCLRPRLEKETGRRAGGGELLQVLLDLSRPVVRRPVDLFRRIGHVPMQAVYAETSLELPRGFVSVPIRADHDARAEVFAQGAQPFDRFAVPVIV